MNPIKKVILGLENTSTITLPIERVSLLELNGIDVLTNPMPDFKRKRPELKIKFTVEVKDFGYYSKISEEQDRWFIYESDRYNLVDITIVYADDSEKIVKLPWSDDDYWFQNKFETLTRLPDGQVQIDVRKQ